MKLVLIFLPTPLNFKESTPRKVVMRNLGTGELFIVVIILFVLFGGKKLPELARGLGEAGKEFNKAFKGDPEPTKKDPPKETHPQKSEKSEEIKD